MNILPKKSWHVRTKKNIERVRRDEAEAERLARIEQDKTLRIEQEVRIRELRLRSNPDEAEPTNSGHINLFEAPEDHIQATNKDHEDERRQEQAKLEQRAGLFNKLVRSEDANKPWYCLPKVDPRNSNEDIRSTYSEKKRQRSDLITSIYDPMTTMRHAEEIIRARRAERQERLTVAADQQTIPESSYRSRLQFQAPSDQQSRSLQSCQKNRDPRESSSSSPEVVKVIAKVKDLVRSDKKRKHSKKKSKKHKRNSPERRHKNHRHKKHKKVFTFERCDGLTYASDWDASQKLLLPPSDVGSHEELETKSSPHIYFGKYIGLGGGFLIVLASSICSRAFKRQGMYELQANE